MSVRRLIAKADEINLVAVQLKKSLGCLPSTAEVVVCLKKEKTNKNTKTQIKTENMSTVSALTFYVELKSLYIHSHIKPL